ncbi:hypothetical protein ACE6H2_005043 [Prunus campanulata]
MDFISCCMPFGSRSKENLLLVNRVQEIKAYHPLPMPCKVIVYILTIPILKYQPSNASD